MSETKAKLTVLISGSGSNLQALIDACANRSLNAEIIRVVSNKKAAYGLERAQKAHIPTAYHNLLEYKKRFPDASESKKFEHARSEYDRDLATLVLADKPDLVVCAGWMHILAPTFLEPLKEAAVPVINLHPALPGQFNGAHAIDEAYRAFQEGKIDHTGIMIHYVILEVDMG
ncbi:putative phosphoribosylglycinamide formyltransferase, partial [Aureobasidium melanogenum]